MPDTGLSNGIKKYEKGIIVFKKEEKSQLTHIHYL